VSSMCTSWFHTGRYRVPQDILCTAGGVHNFI
jgi:hypothetical protein